MISLKRLSKRGIGGVELMVILCLLLVLFAIVSKVIIDNEKNGNFSSFKKLADNFAYKTSFYKDAYERADDTYYLHYLVKSNYIDDVVSPFDHEKCNEYTSYVKYAGSSKFVYLECGEYLITGDYDDSYTVYKISPWSTSIVSGEKETLYNYLKNGNEVIDHYVNSLELIDIYNKNEGKNIKNIKYVNDSDTKLISSVFRRQKDVIKVID